MVKELAVLIAVACLIDLSRKDFQVASYDLVVIRLGERRGKTIHYVQQEETFAKFLFPPTTETPIQVFGCFRFKYPLILPKYPLNPPRIPHNQASEPPFRRQQAHLAC